MSLINRASAFVKKYRYIIIGVIVVLVVAQLLFGGGDTEETATKDILPVVTTTSAAKLSGEQEISVVGTVRAFSEAVITTESSGRVTSVNASLGQTVPAGFVLATLENASERASVLQAEGAYESALAAAEQSNVGVSEANNLLTSSQNTTLSTIRSVMNVTNGVIIGDIDKFFSNPNSPLPGLKIGGQGYTATLNKERVAFQEVLPNWKTRVNSATVESDLVVEIDYAKGNVLRTIELIDIFLYIFDEKDDDDLNSTEQEFIGLRSTLNTQASSLDSAKTQLLNAEDTLRRAELAASGGVSSAADAQVKQALGTLRAAQANLSKTILRTPISGTVNSLNVRVGDFVGMQTVAARVANNNALEIVTYVGDNEVEAFTVGSEVTIENMYTGTVTEIAPAVDPVTRKTEVRIAIETEDIQNGDIVAIGKTFTTEADENQPVVIPLSAVKFEIEDGFVFLVENNQLVQKPVKLGVIRGGSVVIESGLTNSDEFVLDARGLLSDTEVEVRSE